MNFGKTCRSRILVVDDEKLIALTLSAILEDAKYEVRTASSGEEAVKAAASFRPSLLVTDIAMGVMNGIDAAIEITAAQPECKVLFLSGHASVSDIETSTPAHLIYSFISKPARIPDLLYAIDSLLPVPGGASDYPAIEMEHDPLELRNLARTALARLDACRMGSPAWSCDEGEPICSGTEARLELSDQPATVPAGVASWFNNPKHPVADGHRRMTMSRAALLA